MDWSVILNEYILGGVNKEFLISFYIFALIGVLLSMLLHYKKKDSRDKSFNRKKPFDWKYWLKDNVVRFFSSVLCIFIVVRFYSELPIQYELNMFLGLLTGASLDRVIIFIRNRTNIPIFQSKS